MSDSRGAPVPPYNQSAPQPWERELVTKLAEHALAEQRRARRWGIFFKFVAFAYVTVALVLYMPLASVGDGLDEPHTALVELNGAIAADSDASADVIVGGLRAAFEHEQTKGVIVRINSPGGSPVQSGYINDEMRRLREKYPDIPLYAVITDICASGGYYVAVGADAIYADESSLVGSIGVVMNGFGFVDAMKSIGVERRLYTAGKHKGFLDPFSPEQAPEVEHLQTVLKDLHEEFINVVKRGRGDKLADDEKLFSGFVWTGRQGIELGLVDELASAGTVARDVVGVERIVDFTPRKGLFERTLSQFGTSIGAAITAPLQERFQWQ